MAGMGGAHGVGSLTRGLAVVAAIALLAYLAFRRYSDKTRRAMMLARRGIIT